MSGKPIAKVQAAADSLLKVTFDSGNSITVDMKPRFNTFRFGVLKDAKVWNSADTDGNFVHWYKDGLSVAEIAYDEIMKMTLGNFY